MGLRVEVETAEMEVDRGLEVLPVAVAAAQTRIACMRELRPSAPALVMRWSKKESRPSR